MKIEEYKKQILENEKTIKLNNDLLYIINRHYHYKLPIKLKCPEQFKITFEEVVIYSFAGFAVFIAGTNLYYSNLDTFYKLLATTPLTIGTIIYLIDKKINNKNCALKALKILNEKDLCHLEVIKKA